MGVKQDQFIATRAAIIEAGKKLLSQRPAKDIMIKDIMSQCGLSPGLFYHYYKSKDDFFLDLITESWDREIDVLKDESIPYASRLRHYFLALAKDYNEMTSGQLRNEIAYKMTDEYLERRDSTLGSYYMFNHLTDYFAEGIRRGIFSSQLPADFVTRMFVYVIHGINLQVALHKHKDSIMGWCEQFCDYLEETVLKPYILSADNPH